MTDIVNEYFRKFYPANLDPALFEYTPDGGGMFEYTGNGARSGIFPHITCADGFSMSVQGHKGAYSQPRDDFADCYTLVEVGYPSAPEERLMPYFDDIPEGADMTQSVCGYVPVSVVIDVIVSHGGISTEASQSPPDALTIPPVPVDAVMLPEPLSVRMRAWVKMWSLIGPPRNVLLFAEWADEAQALEERIPNGRMVP